MRARTSLMIIVVVFMLAFAVTTIFFIRLPVTQDSSVDVTPRAVTEPSLEWLADFDDHQRRDAIVKKQLSDLQERLRSETDSLDGMALRLNRGVPQGYYFDRRTRKFAPAPPQVATPAPAQK